MNALAVFVLSDRNGEYKNMNKEITVYSKPSCKNCTLLKMWLNSKELDYNEVDVTQERSALNKIREAGYSSLPALEVNGDFVKYEVYNDILDVL